jgi:ACS family glucarate transporter-like MFS transporter
VRNELVLFLFALSAIMFMERVNFGIAGASIRNELGIDNLHLGWAMSALLFGYGVFQLLAGWLAVRIGPRRTIAFGVVWWAVFSALTTVVHAGLAHALLVLMLVRFLLGAGESVVFPASSQFVAAWVPMAERGRTNGWIFAGVGAGAGLTVPLLKWITHTYGWRCSFWFSSAVGLIAGVLWYLASRDTPEEHARVSRAELEHIQATRAPKNKENVEETDDRTWRQLLFNWNSIALTLTYFSFGYVAWIFFAWFFIYLNEVRGLDLKGNVIFAMIPFLAMTACCLLGGWMNDTAVRRWGLRRGRCGVAAGALLLTAVFLLLGARIHGAYLASMVLAGGAGALYISQSSYWSVSVDLAGKRSGVVSSLMNFGNQVGAAATASLTPYIAKHYGWVAPFAVAAVVVAAGGVLWLTIDPSAQEKKLVMQ